MLRGLCSAVGWNRLGNHIVFDIAESLLQGEALDLLHGRSLLHDQRIYSVDMTAVAKADMVIITAGLRRKPDESRLDLINRNVSSSCPLSMI